MESQSQGLIEKRPWRSLTKFWPLLPLWCPICPLWSQLSAQLNILHTLSTSSLKETFLPFALYQQDHAHLFSTKFLSTSQVPGTRE